MSTDSIKTRPESTESTPVTVATKRHDPRSMFLREVIASGTIQEGPRAGQPFELATTGPTLILSVGGFEGTPPRVVETISAEALVRAWLPGLVS